MSNGSGLMNKQAAAKPHLEHAGGLSGEIADLRADVGNELAPLAAFTVEEWTTPPATANDAIIQSPLATVAAVTSYSGADFDGVNAGYVFDPPRNVTITTGGATAADAPATALVTGTDVNGDALTETLTLSQVAGDATGAKAFRTIDKIDMPAADGTGATLLVGIGDVLGLAKPIKSRAGFTGLLLEVSGGAAVSTGTLVDAATSAPNGTYTPATGPNGVNNYAVYYEYDPTA